MKTMSADGDVELKPFVPTTFELFASFTFSGDYCRTSSEIKAAKRSFKVCK